MWLAAKHPELVKSLSLHSGWTATDPYLRVVVQGWQTMAKALGSTTDMVIQGIFPWCFTPELYASKPEYIESLAGFVRSRPMPPVDAFLRQSDAVLAHDVTGALNLIQAPTQITFGQFDAATSVRFAGPLTEAIDGAELVIFEGCAHAPIYENVAEFNARTMDFLTRNSLRSPSLGGERAVGEPGASGRAEREIPHGSGRGHANRPGLVRSRDRAARQNS
jgi:pimeloyl-ACP methyl ester carboxylesterase